MIGDDEELFPDEDAESLAPEDRPPRYRCRGCAYRADKKWSGACPACRRPWNIVDSLRADPRSLVGASMANYKPIKRLATGFAEFDKVLGATTGPDGRPYGPAGMRPGHVYLLGGMRGGGKSTLMLQVADAFAKGERRALFASNEMSKDAVMEYAWRAGFTAESKVEILGNLGDIYKIRDHAEENRERLVIVDSLQTASVPDVDGDVGSKSQIDAVTNTLSLWAQKRKAVVVFIGHLTRSGDYAGGATLEHLADVLLRFDPVTYDKDGKLEPCNPEESDLRQLALGGKNRGGALSAFSLLEMTPTGIKPAERSNLLPFPGGDRPRKHRGDR